MDEPRLVILGKIDGIPVHGVCSVCHDVAFYTGAPIGLVEEHEQRLERLFRWHLTKAHIGNSDLITCRR
jgi:hypothetical protein